jgi:hypothetical protein
MQMNDKSSKGKISQDTPDGSKGEI